MTCCICNDNYGMCFCENDCSCILCIECINKLTSKKCPQCRETDLKINLFFGGKICVENPLANTRRYVIKGNEEDYEYLKRNILENPGVIGDCECSENMILKYDDYINVKKEIDIQKIGPITNITGPFVIVDENYIHGIWTHGLLCDNTYTNVKSVSNIVNHRNYQMIEKCHVFCLKINDEFDCFRSIAEWGIASSMGKILIIDLDKDFVKRNEKNKKLLGEFYLFAQESLNSLETLSFPRRHAVFKSHPHFKINYSKYKQMMNKIISFKK